jgi:hypothetical protein
MKTIEVSDEIYDFLMNLSKEVKTQDNRATRMPYFYQVQEDKEVAVPDGCGNEVWVMDGEICLRTEQDIKEAVFEWRDWDLDDLNDDKEYEKLSSSDIDEILRNNYSKVSVNTKHKYSNSFLTEKACREHIRANRHNLDNPKTYLDHAYRNAEMDMLFKFLDELTLKNKE